MQLDLSDDQALFHETTVRFIETELPLPATRTLHDNPVGYDRAWLAKSAELGWFAMLVPEADGGGCVSGNALLDAVLVAEEMGRFVQPGPFVPMNVVADVVARHGSDAQRAEFLPGIVSGETVATWAFADAAGNWDDGAGLTIDRVEGGLRLSGTRGVVQDAQSADCFLVAGQLEGRPAQVIVRSDAAGLTQRRLHSLDLSRRFADVLFSGVVVAEAAFLPSVDLESALHTAVVLNLAEMIGAMDALFSMTVAYSKDRIAFGRPIGSFQALKHVLADQALSLETAKACAVAAANAVQTGDETAAEVVSMASAVVGDIGHDLAQECLQVHGGIGYTWEHDLHLLMRRIQSNAVLYGEPSWHRERVCSFHNLGGAW
jgi:alkylation response protein AidB-like acyl-CoA dehydrogenase